MKNQKSSERSPILIIAETGTSHNGDLNRAAKLIDASAEAGADCLKTQIVFADEIIHPNTGEVALPGGNVRLYDRFLELEQDFDFYCKLKNMTEAAGLSFLASPFGFKSLDWLLELGCKTIKIASPELNHFPLLKRAAASGKKLILSTGVSKIEDIAAALITIRTASPQSAPAPVLLHCITSYPAPETEYNLRLLSTLTERFGVDVGISDHSRDPVLVPAAAAASGAGYIEKHITLQNDDGGLDDPIALTPDEFRTMTTAVRKVESQLNSRKDGLKILEQQFGRERIEAVLGDGIKALAPSEAANYGRTNRSVHALHELPAGTILTAENTALLRTEKKLKPGMRPEFYNKLLGKKLSRTVASGQGVTLEDIK